MHRKIELTFICSNSLEFTPVCTYFFTCLTFMLAVLPQALRESSPGISGTSAPLALENKEKKSYGDSVSIETSFIKTHYKYIFTVSSEPLLIGTCFDIIFL